MSSAGLEPNRHRPTTRARLLAGAALVAWAIAGQAAAEATADAQATTTAVQAQGVAVQTVSVEPAQGRQIGPDGLAKDGLYMQAQTIIEDEDSGTLTARGSVEARYQGRTLRADEIVYETATGLVTARGNALIVNADGSIQYADTIELDEDLRAGVVTGFATRGQQNQKLAAATAIRRSETLNELTNAIFTACDICNDEGEPKTPTWTIQADQVVQDRDAKVVYYRNAVLKAFDVPVFYAPVFWHADPTAERASGLLTPKVSLSDRRGFSYEQPYLWVISPYQDLVISPQINADVNPFLNLDWRKRFFSGAIEARAGYTYERDVQNGGGIYDVDGDLIRDGETEFGEDRHRSYVLASGRFDVDENWRWGFGLERVSDKGVFDKYEIGDVYEERGLFSADTRRLVTQAYAERQTDSSYVSIAAMSFQSLVPTQGLRSNGVPYLTFERDEALPVVGPLIEARWDPQTPILGGRLRLLGSGVLLTRELAPEALRNPALTEQTARGVDAGRATLQADWRRTITTRAGLRVEPFLVARGDVYNFKDLPVAGPFANTTEDETVTRGFATAGVEISYPLIRRGERSSIIIEPIAQLAISPEYDSPLPVQNAVSGVRYNEDSTVTAFDETNLFRTNRAPGFDIYEGGARLSVGVRATADWGDGRRARLLIGRTFRDEEQRQFLVAKRDPLTGQAEIVGGQPVLVDASGLASKNSDWVIAADVTPLPNLNVWGRARVDEGLKDVARAEAGGYVAFDRFTGGFAYLKDTSEVTGSRVSDLTLFARAFATDNWGVGVVSVIDREQDVERRRELSLIYRDECTWLEIVYQREETFAVGGRPTESIQLRLNLATLGAAGYDDFDYR